MVVAMLEKRKEDYTDWQFTYLKSILLIDDGQVKW